MLFDAEAERRRQPYAAALVTMFLQLRCFSIATEELLPRRQMHARRRSPATASRPFAAGRPSCNTGFLLHRHAGRQPITTALDSAIYFRFSASGLHFHDAASHAAIISRWIIGAGFLGRASARHAPCSAGRLQRRRRRSRHGFSFPSPISARRPITSEDATRPLD